MLALQGTTQTSRWELCMLWTVMWTTQGPTRLCKFLILAGKPNPNRVTGLIINHCKYRMTNTLWLYLLLGFKAFARGQHVQNILNKNLWSILFPIDFNSIFSMSLQLPHSRPRIFSTTTLGYAPKSSAPRNGCWLHWLPGTCNISGAPSVVWRGRCWSVMRYRLGYK